MAEEMVVAENLMRDIFEAETSLRWFEQKYGLLSEIFYTLYQQGQLRDEDPAEVLDYTEWAGWYEIYQDRRERYQKAVQKRIQEIATPASLTDLHFSQLKVPA